MQDVMRPGEEGLWQQFSSAQTISWNRRAHRALVSGPVEVTVEARSAFGTSGLVRPLTLAAPPTPTPKPTRGATTAP